MPMPMLLTLSLTLPLPLPMPMPLPLPYSTNFSLTIPSQHLAPSTQYPPTRLHIVQQPVPSLFIPSSSFPPSY